MIPLSLSILLGLEGLWPIQTPMSQHPSDFQSFTPHEWEPSVLPFNGCTAFIAGPDQLLITNQHCIKSRLKTDFPEIWSSGFAAQSRTAGVDWPDAITIQDVEYPLSLLFVPPEDAAFYGGEDLNWRWPRYSADIALFQIHAPPEGPPIPKGLPLSRHAPQEGDAVMVLGYPAHTIRGLGQSSFEASRNQILWEAELQEAWASRLEADGLFELANVTPDSRLKLLSHSLPAFEPSPESETAQDCYNPFSHQLLYLKYLEWSSRYLSCAIQYHAAQSCSVDLASLHPNVERLLLKTSLEHDPFRQSRSRKWRHAIEKSMPFLDSPNSQYAALPPPTGYRALAKLIQTERASLKAQARAHREACTSKQSLPYPNADRSLRYSMGFIEGHADSEALTSSPLSTQNNAWINFTSSADISRGSSGSPTLTPSGEVIGIVFDMDSLALLSDWSYQTHGRSIHVDIRYLRQLLIDADAEWLIEALFETPQR